MNWKTSLLIICCCFLACNSSNKNATLKKDVNASVSDDDDGINYVSKDHIVEVDELERLIGSNHIKIIHFGKPEEYAAAHIPSAINIWRTDIESNQFPYKGMIASKQKIEALFSNLGIANTDTLLVYDNVASCDAARLWWVLQNYGFNSVRILNGGLKAWKAKGGILTAEKTLIKTSSFKLPEKAPMLTYFTKEEMLAAINKNDSVVVLDTRTVDEFTGKRQKIGASSAGRIPKSKLVNWADCVNYNGDKKFKSPKVLSEIYDDILRNKKDNVITYCHSGVRSAHTTFVLTELLGYKNVKNYDGSWVEWSYFKDYPKEKDLVTTILH